MTAGALPPKEASRAGPPDHGRVAALADARTGSLDAITRARWTRIDKRSRCRGEGLQRGRGRRSRPCGTTARWTTADVACPPPDLRGLGTGVDRVLGERHPVAARARRGEDDGHCLMRRRGRA